MNKDFDSIRPYVDSEIPDAMQRVCSDKAFSSVASFLMPGKDENILKSLLLNCKTVDDFQHKVMTIVVKKVVDETVNNFTCGGLENVDPKRRYLFVTNHRDIVLDSAFLQLLLYNNNIPTTEIAVGDNLITTLFIEDIVRCNKMVKVVRSTNPRELLASSKRLSSFIRESVSTNRSSIWIAQRNGRTKDGIDVTEQGLLKMFSMSGCGDFCKDFSELNILPIAISYEFEPCDIFKASELFIKRSQKYVKAPDEDLNSILQGIMQYKGSVHYEFCKPIENEKLAEFASIDSEDKNEKFKALANLITQRINGNYKLVANNYIAHDILKGSNKYADKYTTEQKQGFVEYMNLKMSAVEKDREEVEKIFLGIYANPVVSKEIALKA